MFDGTCGNPPQLALDVEQANSVQRNQPKDSPVEEETY